jgi:dynein heavy chain
MDNIMERNYTRVGRSDAVHVKVGDADLEVHRDFRLYVTTKMPNPNLAPELFAHATVTNFTVTMAGLEEQLLGHVSQMLAGCPVSQSASH